MKLLNIHIILFLFIFISCVGHKENEKNEFNAKMNIDSITNNGALIEINPEGLLKMLKYDKNAFVVDIRKPDTTIRECKLIKGYQHIEDKLIYKNLNLLPKGKTIVLLSKDGIKSRKLGTFLSKKGMTVYNLKGGMDSYWAWRENIIREKLKIYDKEIDVVEIYAEDFGC